MTKIKKLVNEKNTIIIKTNYWCISIVINAMSKINGLYAILVPRINKMRNFDSGIFFHTILVLFFFFQFWSLYWKKFKHLIFHFYLSLNSDDITRYLNEMAHDTCLLDWHVCNFWHAVHDVRYDTLSTLPDLTRDTMKMIKSKTNKQDNIC
jgi:hypothetical protein